MLENACRTKLSIIMNRLHSTTGCYRCKLRRKKCDEKRPVCSGCARWPQWRDSCSYDVPLATPRSSSKMILKFSADDSKSPPIRRLGAVRHCGNELESRILQVIPEMLSQFFSPLSGDHIRNLQTMWQLMASNEILRNAFVACFSRFLDDSTALVRLSREAYGKTLQGLRSKILQVNSDQETAISVVISMVFLGKLESFAPHLNTDALEHWGPLIPLLASAQIEKLAKNRVLPANEMTVVFEGLLYHVGTHGIFSRTTERIWHLWKSYNLYQRLCANNPEGPDRIRRSPALSGQYLLYDMAFYVIYLLRSHADSHLPRSRTDELEIIIRQHDSRLDRDFAVMSGTTNRTKYCAESAVYHLFCNSLLICITALREPSKSQRLQMARFVNSGMKMFLDLPVYGDVQDLSEHASHYLLTAIWPIEIQGCAIYDTKQFQQFIDHYALLERYLDPGHQIRARCLFDQVRTLLEKAGTEGESGPSSTKAVDRPIPVGLALLRSVVKLPESGQKTNRL